MFRPSKKFATRYLIDTDSYFVDPYVSVSDFAVASGTDRIFGIKFKIKEAGYITGLQSWSFDSGDTTVRQSALFGPTGTKLTTLYSKPFLVHLSDPALLLPNLTYTYAVYHTGATQVSVAPIEQSPHLYRTQTQSVERQDVFTSSSPNPYSDPETVWDYLPIEFVGTVTATSTAGNLILPTTPTSDTPAGDSVMKIEFTTYEDVCRDIPPEPAVSSGSKSFTISLPLATPIRTLTIPSYTNSEPQYNYGVYPPDYIGDTDVPASFDSTEDWITNTQFDEWDIQVARSSDGGFWEDWKDLTSQPATVKTYTHANLDIYNKTYYRYRYRLRSNSYGETAWSETAYVGKVKT